ncbi:hypothetical protein IFM89_020621 [Coptis chinensis]|uniref:Reverse transcriptase zinc-binding domain-containing protein n=1 Tax=Coptis chinensis TaxID=261450 RepID=A0A835M384_9MAGN|nr:hypothetical protein IFM89_020621 [Coptis chinensis]
MGVDKVVGKLDRVFYNNEWNLLHPGWRYKALCKLCSDHSPIVGWSISIPRPRNVPFKFFKMWTTHPSLKDLVIQSWSEPMEGYSVFVLTQKLKCLKGKLKSWNRNIFGNLGTKVREESKALENMKKESERNYNDTLANEIINQANKVEGLLEQEESFWRQKSKDLIVEDIEERLWIFTTSAKELPECVVDVETGSKYCFSALVVPICYLLVVVAAALALAADSGVSIVDQHREDSRVWRQSTNGLFSVGSAYEAIRERANVLPWTKFLWSAEVMLRTLGTGWEILHGAMRTYEKLRGKNFQMASRCCICTVAEETQEHILFECSFAQRCWELIANNMHHHTRIANREEMFTKCRNESPLLQDLWKAASISCFAIWRNRNGIIYGSKKSSISSVMSQVRGGCKAIGLSLKVNLDNVFGPPKPKSDDVCLSSSPIQSITYHKQMIGWRLTCEVMTLDDGRCAMKQTVMEGGGTWLMWCAAATSLPLLRPSELFWLATVTMMA